MTNKFTFETTDLTLASAILDLINGGAKPAKAHSRAHNEARSIEGVKSSFADPAPAPATPAVEGPQAPQIASAAPTPGAPTPDTPAPAVQVPEPAAVLATPAAEPPVTSDQLMKALSDFLAKFGHDAAKEVFAKHQAPPSISALVAESADKARAVFNDFSARLNA